MVWLIGCNGMLGTEVSRQLSDKKIEFVGTDREVDFTDFSSIEKFASDKKIDFIINCAAYTAVDKAESEIEFATKLNVEGPRNIACLAKKIGAKLIHISTDYVFDGTGDIPKTENDKIAPIGVYGKTKADGEKAIQEEFDEYYILRTAWLYGFDGKNFVYTMIRAMNSRDSVKVVNDQRGTPTFCGDLANVIISVIEVSTGSTSEKIPYGIYHVTNIGETTWFEFTKEIQKQATENGLLTNKCVVNPCTTEDYPTPAKRPLYSVLDKTKIQNALKMTLPEWKDSLSKFLKSPNFNKDMIS